MPALETSQQTNKLTGWFGTGTSLTIQFHETEQLQKHHGCHMLPSTLNSASIFKTCSEQLASLEANYEKPSSSRASLSLPLFL